MDFSFTEAQEDVADLTRQILQGKLSEERMRQVEAGVDRFDRDLWDALARADILGIALPTDVGGSGHGMVEQMRVLIELGRHVAPVPVLPSIVLGAMAIAAFGSEAQKTDWALPGARGSVVLTAALTEDLNPTPHEPVTRAERSGTGWRMTGTKTTIPAGPIADLLLVPADTDEGVTVFLVRPDDDGVRLDRQQIVDKDAEAMLRLDAVEIPDDRVLGEVGQGSDIYAFMERRAIVGLCSLQVGVCERAVEMTAEYSKERVQFERPIASFQAVGQRLADAYIDVEAIRLTTLQAAWRLAEGLPCDAEIETAKFWAADAGHRVAHTAVHIHGGVGIDVDHPAHRYFIAAKRNEFALGGATAQLRRLGRRLAADPAGPIPL